MKRYAFIDVPNTSGTTNTVLGFQINWEKLYEFLVNDKWSCSTVFYYKGYKGEKEKEQLEKLRAVGYKVQTKLTHIYADRYKEVRVSCPTCTGDFSFKEKIKGHQKSNCDVELTVDALEVLKTGDEALLFSGDGDFAYLIEKLLERGVTVRIISSKNKDSMGHVRFSTRLTELLEREEKGEKRVQFIHIDNWKHRIQRENTEDK